MTARAGQVPGSSRVRRFSLVLAVVLVPLVVSGCGVLFPAMGVPGIGGVGQDGIPTVKATYATGLATLKITTGGKTSTVTLDTVVPGSQLMSTVGATVTWWNSDGWALQLQAFDITNVPGMPSGFDASVPGQLSIEHVNGHDFWTTQDYTSENRCIVDVPTMSETEVRGSATCKGLRWIDGVAGSSGSGFGAVPYVAGQDPFDADVTFSAKP